MSKPNQALLFNLTLAALSSGFLIGSGMVLYTLIGARTAEGSQFEYLNGGIFLILLGFIAAYIADKKYKALRQIYTKQQGSSTPVNNEIDTSAPTANICEKCDKSGLFNIAIADTGRCSCCHTVAECCDIDLLGFYKALGITDDQIWKSLPRLRNSGVTGSSGQYTLTAIGEKSGG